MSQQSLQAAQDAMRARALTEELKEAQKLQVRTDKEYHREYTRMRDRAMAIAKQNAVRMPKLAAKQAKVDRNQIARELKKGESRAEYATSGRGSRPAFCMSPDDPLYEMLPSEDKIDKLKWQPRQNYQMPPNMRTTGINDPIKVSCTRMVQLFLLDERRSQCDRQGRSRFLQLLLRLHEIAMGKGPQAVAAINVLMERAFGKIKPSDEELDVSRQRGFNVVYVERIQNNLPVHEDTPALLPQPEFLDGELVPQPEAGQEFGARE
jgi:hypothetical protein